MPRPKGRGKAVESMSLGLREDMHRRGVGGWGLNPRLRVACAQRRRGLFKDSRSHLIDIREALHIRCASRISIRSALRANFEQTAPGCAARSHPA